ncbi:MAG: efflux RND transporter periplasmic adaptor subunit [Candidatus Falkowbacteria bacterium]|nr:efflux RND transporter periplasmic adaptor subunit [Candidatus Falkowbacteria bacterium]
MTKKKIIIISIIVVVVAAGAWYLFAPKTAKIEYTTADVTKGTLLQTVSETGTITPAKEIELNFLSSGQLAKVNVKVGDQVVPDQVLGEVDFSNLSIRQQEAMASVNVSNANVRQAQSAFDSARREYDKLSASLSENVKQAEKTLHDLSDTGPSTVTTYEQAISTADSNLASTKSTYQRIVDNKFDSLQSTIDNKLSSANTALDSVYRVLNDDNLKPTLSVKNSGVLNQTRNSYTAAKESVTRANAALTVEKNSRSLENLNSANIATQSALADVFSACNLAFSALENTITSSTLSQAQLDAFKASIEGQINSVSISITALQSADQALDDAKLSYDTNVLSATQSVSQARASYDNALIAARNAVNTSKVNRDQQLSSAQTRIDNAQSNLGVASAQVGQASANLALVANQISDNVLKSPIKGIITKVNYDVGEQVTPAKAFLSVLTENNYQIEVDISETDIDKVKLNNTAEITLDALGPDVKFEGKVYFVEPAATIIQGVTYYKVKVSFDPAGKGDVKPGMTASAIIMTNKKENILIMPARAVIEKNGKNIVRILENNVVREADVAVGLSGDNGMVEVTSGVKEGDKVVTFVKDSSKK